MSASEAGMVFVILGWALVASQRIEESAGRIQHHNFGYVLVNALTVHVGTGTDMPGNPTLRALARQGCARKLLTVKQSRSVINQTHEQTQRL